MLNDSRGDARNLSLMDLEKAAKAAGITVREVVDNLKKSVAARGKPLCLPTANASVGSNGIVLALTSSRSAGRQCR